MLAPVVAALAVAAGGIAQAVTGIGFSLVCVPFLIAAFGPREGVRIGLALSAMVNLAMLARAGREAEPRRIVPLLVPAVLATPVLAAVTRHAPTRLLTGVAGALTIGASLALGRGLRLRHAGGRRGAAVAGVLSAGMNVVASIGGPAAALWTVNAGWAPARARPTLQVYFLTLNVVAAISLGLPRSGTRLLGVVTVAALVGLAAGRHLDERVSEGLALRATLGVASAGGLLALARAVVG